MRKKKITPQPAESSPWAQRHYYQLVESHRVDGKPRQRVLAHLGKYQSVEEALEKLPQEIELLRQGGFSEKAIQERCRRLERLEDLRRQGVTQDVRRRAPTFWNIIPDERASL